eukprot:CAMPEP_0119494510 /NCGR_PEP_ID=MMETSP1344-20130328/18435_1 /TAXON_ID=236787 /ORGANISM="Florenciella parvula, Strain CCMP2471" /LENGTH=99 /DNA_ID=CAMNT_0007530015 /DNA_START=8 /DNA_END=303 /DNA_ORIENTATION=+
MRATTAVRGGRSQHRMQCVAMAALAMVGTAAGELMAAPITGNSLRPQPAAAASGLYAPPAVAAPAEVAADPVLSVFDEDPPPAVGVAEATETNEVVAVG